MTGALKYPGANTTAQWKGTRPEMARIDKLLLHTTESSDWPSYPSFFPTFTFNPWEPRGKRWRQHCNVNQASTTLANAGSYQTNRQNVCQIEIVAWVDPKQATSSAYYTKISADAYAELGEFYAWLNKEWGTPIQNSLTWKEYRNTPPSSYGVNNGVRLSRSEFTAYKGLCGHMHAPEQSHGDPSLLNVGLIIEKAKAAAGGTTPVSYPKPTNKKVYLSKLVLGQQDSDSVYHLQAALNVLGAQLTLNGDLGKTAFEAWAREVFDEADYQVEIINDL